MKLKALAPALVFVFLCNGNIYAMQDNPIGVKPLQTLYAAQSGAGQKGDKDFYKNPSKGDPKAASYLGDTSRGNHPLAKLEDTDIIVPRPGASQYSPEAPSDGSGFIPRDINGHWAEKDIRKYVEEGYASGYPGGLFKPDEAVTYGEFAAMTAKLNLKPVRFNGGFYVAQGLYYSKAPSKWYYNSFMIASEAGIFGNQDNGDYKILYPYNLNDLDKPMLREHAALFLANLVAYDDDLGTVSFKDEKDFDTFQGGACLNAAKKLAKHNFMQGYAGDLFKPKGYITRAEMVSVLSGILEEYHWDMLAVHDNLYGNYYKYYWDEEEKLAELVNQERKEAGIHPLKVLDSLTAIARIKSIDMLINDYFDHYSLSFGYTDDLAEKFGYTFYLGENITTAHFNAETSHDAWFNSPGHRENYMNGKYYYMGCGIDVGGSVEELALEY